MSAVAFGALARKRQEADSGKSTNVEQPGLRTYVDTLAALVPAEVLGAHAVILSFTTETQDGETVITDRNALKIAFWTLIVLSALFYVAGFQKRKWTLWAALGALIPPAAFVAWTMAARISAFDVIGPDLELSTRDTIAVLAAMVLGLAATAVPILLDRADPKR